MPGGTELESGPPTYLVTGITGQDGVLLARSLLADGHRVVGISQGGPACAARIAAYLPELTGSPGTGGQKDWQPVDLGDPGALSDYLHSLELPVGAAIRVFHLAGFSSIAQSFEQPELVRRVNDVAVRELLDALPAGARFFLASSAAAAVGDSPYAESKRAAEEHVRTARAAGRWACFARLHNHESPLRPRTFVTRKITSGVAEIAAGKREQLVLGNLGVRRDWGSATDVVRAMRLMLERDEPVDLEIGTGVAHSLTDLIEIAFDAAGLGAPGDRVVSDAGLLRPSDAEVQVADPEPARAALGWEPQVGFEQLVRHMVAVDLRRVETGVEESADYLDPDRVSGRGGAPAR